eukprot:6963662-Alexandrium_andersonii.AAC.1
MFRDSVAQADSPQTATPSADALSSETLADMGALVRSLAEGRSCSNDGVAGGFEHLAQWIDSLQVSTLKTGSREATRGKPFEITHL